MEANEYDDSEELYEIEEKWHGVPPAGTRPPPGRTRYLFEIMGILIFEFILWGLYRYFTAPIYGEGFNFPFYIGHIIAAPTISLGPILLYWKFIRKEPIVYKDDLENGKHMSFNLGPFKMTKKRLMTAVLVGLIGGVIWRVTEMIVENSAGVILGGRVFFSMKLLDVFSIEGGGFPLFFMMTFVMFFIVGPVEEFEFRAFTFDQSQRVLSPLAALVFSSMFFGFSHLPIAIFIYKMSIGQLIFQELSWMAAGATLGALYMWSRNIFAVIVMHGIGNWQLSVFWLQGRDTVAGLSDTMYYVQSFIVTVLANGILILLFYLVYRYYWSPQERGEAAFGGKMMRIQQFFFQHDNSQKRSSYTWGVLSVVTVILLVVLFSITAGLGIKSDMAVAARENTVSEEGLDLTQYLTQTSSNLSSEYLPTGESMEFNLDSTTDMIIKSVHVRVTWQDETDKPGRPTIRRYTNQPDTFHVLAQGPNITAEDEQANPVDGQGSIEFILDINDSAIQQYEGNFNVSVTVTLVEAGPWNGLAILGWTDQGNAFDILLDITYLQSPGETTGGEPSSGE